MKRIELYVNGEHFVIEECEGRAEIRRADAARAQADRYITTSVRIEGKERALTLKVECRE